MVPARVPGSLFSNPVGFFSFSRPRASPFSPWSRRVAVILLSGHHRALSLPSMARHYETPRSENPSFSCYQVSPGWDPLSPLDERRFFLFAEFLQFFVPAEPQRFQRSIFSFRSFKNRSTFFPHPGKAPFFKGSRHSVAFSPTTVPNLLLSQ